MECEPRSSGMSEWQNSDPAHRYAHVQYSFIQHSIYSLISFNRCLFVCCENLKKKRKLYHHLQSREWVDDCGRNERMFCELKTYSTFSLSFSLAMTEKKNILYGKIWNDNIFFIFFLFSIVSRDHFTHFHSVERRRRLSRVSSSCTAEHFCVWIFPSLFVHCFASSDISSEYWRFLISLSTPNSFWILTHPPTESFTSFLRCSPYIDDIRGERRKLSGWLEWGWNWRRTNWIFSFNYIRFWICSTLSNDISSYATGSLTVTEMWNAFSILNIHRYFYSKSLQKIFSYQLKNCHDYPTFNVFKLRYSIFTLHSNSITII